MLHVKDSLFSMVRRYTPWGNFGSEVMGNLARRCEFLEQPESTVRYSPWGNLAGRFFDSVAFSLHFRGAIGHILCYNFQRRMKPSPL